MSRQQWIKQYPGFPKGDEVLAFHGEKVADPYQGLEDLDHKDTVRFIEQQNALTFSFLRSIPYRMPLRKRLIELASFDFYSVLFGERDWYFFFAKKGVQKQFVLYKQQGLDGAPKTFIDPNEFDHEGGVAFSTVKLSRNGRYMAYGLRYSGKDWQEWYVRDTQTDEDLPNKLDKIKFSFVEWNAESTGFYYSGYKGLDSEDFGAKDPGQVLKYHELNSEQSADEIIFELMDQPDSHYVGRASSDGRYLFVVVENTAKGTNSVYVNDLTAPGRHKEFSQIFADGEHEYVLIGDYDERYYFRTTEQADFGRLVAVSGSPGAWQVEEIVGDRGVQLETASILEGKLYINYVENAVNVVKIYQVDGTFLDNVKMPELGTLAGFLQQPEPGLTFFRVSNHITPSTLYKYDLVKNECELYQQPELAYDRSKFTTQLIDFPSHDGTKVSMFLVHRKDLQKNKNNPVLLSGYGGFGVSNTPVFQPAYMAWLEAGGVYAIANVRGGGEQGEQWHRDGMKLNKRNSFLDFIAAAEYLIDAEYSCPEKMAAMGRSNGGLLVAAAMIMRPELFRAVIPIVGVLDMLRFHHFTIGWAWQAEYGNVEIKEEYEYMKTYSPLHNLNGEDKYPAVMALTGKFDDRVFPAHTLKFIAKLQSTRSNLFLARIDGKTGHGYGRPTDATIDEFMDILCFLFDQLGFTPRVDAV